MILSKLHGKMVTSLGAAFAAVAMVPRFSGWWSILYHVSTMSLRSRYTVPKF